MLLSRLLAAAAAAGSLLLAGQAPATAGPPAPLEVEFAVSDGVPVLVDQNGRQYPVTVTTSPERQVTEGGRTLLARTVRLGATLPGTQSLPGPVTNASAGGCEDDGSFSVEACLTQFYTRSGSYVAVDRYTASWSRYSTQARLVKGTILAGVLGRCRPGSSCTSLSKTESRVVNYPVSGTAYSLYPTWRGIFTEISGVRYQCGNSTLNWSRGTGSYRLDHSPVCQGGIP